MRVAFSLKDFEVRASGYDSTLLSCDRCREGRGTGTVCVYGEFVSTQTIVDDARKHHTNYHQWR